MFYYIAVCNIRYSRSSGVLAGFSMIESTQNTSLYPLSLTPSENI